MDLRRCLGTLGCALATLCLGAGLSAQAATINATYASTVFATGDAANSPLIGSGSGSVPPLGNMTWSDRAFPNLTTGAVEGTFTMTFANGSTLFGNLQEQIDFTAPPDAAPITQTLNITGGTGAFLWYNGTLTGSGIADLVGDTGVSISGAGTLNTAPEPGSVALLAMGLLCLTAYCKRALRSRSREAV